MGTIIPRKRKDGSTAYTVLIRIKRDKKVVHQESQTFDREPAAKAWMAKREGELAQPGALKKVEDPLLADVIDQYNREKQKKHGKTKTQVLNTIKASALGKKRCSEIDSPALVEFAKGLALASGEPVQPSTRGNYMSHLSSIFTVARPAWGYPLDTQAMADAMVVLKKLGLVAKSNERDRRPTLAELDQLMAHYAIVDVQREDSIPMRKLILFAIFSTRRQEEICTVVGADLERDRLQLVVRDMKNPGDKIGNDVRTTLTPEALEIIDTRPAGQGRIWPYNHKSVSSSFTRACKVLGIKDLCFHDLRHEGISRLFEMGWNIPQVATVSGHRQWVSLKRYEHMVERGDKYADWPWRKHLQG